MAEELTPWTSKEIAERISLDPALLARAKAEWDAPTQSTRIKPVSEDEARAIIEGLIQEPFVAAEMGAPEAMETKALARLIVGALPKEAMNGSVLTALDVRPYIQLVTSEPGRKFSETQRAETPVDAILTAGDPMAGQFTFTDLGEKWSQLQENDYRTTNSAYTQTNQAGVAPQVVATENATAGVSAADTNPFIDGVQTIDPGDLASMLRTGKIDINDPQLQDAPISAGNLPGVFTSAPGGVGRVSQRELPSGKIIGRTTVGGMLDWAFGLNENEVSNLQSLLANAGYMTDMRYDAQTDQWVMQDMQYEDGYANDPVFQQAMVMAVRDTYAQGNGMSVSRWLEQKTVEFKQREDVMRTRLTEERMTKFQDALSSTQAAADRMALDTLGRRLTPDEYVQVRQYLRELQTGRVDDAYGVNAEPWMSEAPTKGFTQAEFEQGVTDVMMPEIEGRMGMSTNRQMKKWLGID
jgi:hypothetical protein